MKKTNALEVLETNREIFNDNQFYKDKYEQVEEEVKALRAENAILRWNFSIESIKHKIDHFADVIAKVLDAIVNKYTCLSPQSPFSVLLLDIRDRIKTFFNDANSGHKEQNPSSHKRRVNFGTQTTEDCGVQTKTTEDCGVQADHNDESYRSFVTKPQMWFYI